MPPGLSSEPVMSSSAQRSHSATFAPADMVTPVPDSTAIGPAAPTPRRRSGAPRVLRPERRRSRYQRHRQATRAQGIRERSYLSQELLADGALRSEERRV